MRLTRLPSLAVACVLVAACGPRADGPVAEGPVLGTWELDTKATIDANLDRVLASARAHVATLEAEVRGLDESIPAGPDDRRLAARDEARAKLLEETRWDPERTEILTALFRSTKAATELVEAKARTQAEGLVRLKLDMTFRRDSTYVVRLDREGQIEVSSGIWTLAGDRVTATTTAENGVAIRGAAGDPQIFEAKDGALETRSGALVVRMRRRSGPETDASLDPARVDPCAYVTAAEITALVGRGVKATESTGRTMQCAFETDAEPTWRTVVIRFERRRKDQAARFRLGMGRTEPVPGLGDLAYGNSVGLYVLKGELSFEVFVRMKPDVYEQDAVVAEAIARVILPRLK